MKLKHKFPKKKINIFAKKKQVRTNTRLQIFKETDGRKSEITGLK